MKILAVDDEPVFLEALRIALRRLGHDDVKTVASGAEALAALGHGQDRYDCMLFDIKMPEMDGIELTQAVRNIPAYYRTPIVMVTRVSDRNSIDYAFSAGATDYITKPLDHREFAARLNMVERLVNERNRNTARSAQNQSDSDAQVLVSQEFEAPRLIPRIGGMMEFIALENYLLTMKKPRLLSLSAFGVCIENAATLYCASSPEVFEDVIGDVAAAIFYQLKAHQFMFAHAGSGDFACLISRRANVDHDQLTMQINDILADYETVYAADGLPQPRVHVGNTVSTPLFLLARPNQLLFKAILAAQSNNSMALQSPKMVVNS